MTTPPIIETPGPPPEPAAEAWLNVTAKLGSIAAAMTSDRSDRQKEQPLRGPLYRSGVIPSSGPLVLDLGAPAMGRRWTVTNLSLSDGADVTTAVTGKANVYAGMLGAYGPPGWRWTFAALPAIEKFSSDQIGIVPPDRLLVVVTGGTSGQTVLARAEVLDYPIMLPETVMPV